MNIEDSVLIQRKKKDHFMRNDPESPLTPKQRKKFSELEYFPYDNQFQVEGSIQLYKEKMTIEIPTSKGTTQKYNLYGKFSFEIQRYKLNLQVYESLDDSHYFVPFMDET